MQAIQITVRDMPHSLALESEIRKKADKLNQFYHHINSCHVTVQIPQKHKHQGKLYSVHIDLGVPGNTLVVNHKIDENVHIAIRDAFRAAQRQLSSYSHKRRGDVKVHEIPHSGTIKKLFLDEGYGFIEGADGHEYFWNEDNLVTSNYDHLKVGDKVHFVGMAQTDGLHAYKIIKNN